MVFAVTKTMACVAYDCMDWMGWKHEDFAAAATEELELAAEPVQDVIRPANPKMVAPEGFLIGKDGEDGPNAWQWFNRYEPRPAGDDQRKWSQPRLPSALRAGQQVQCTGKVLAAREGPVTLIALAQAREKPSPPKNDKPPPKPELRRSAVVAVSGQLAMAQLMSAEEGYITPTDPPVFMPESELRPLQQQVSSFLSPKNVSTLKSQFGRAAPLPTSTPRRSQRSNSSTSTSSARAPSAAPTPAHAPAATACPDLPLDLYRVSEKTLAGFSLEQLKALCAERQLAVPSGAEILVLVTKLKAYRDRRGRLRRSLSTPSESQTLDGSQHSSGNDSDSVSVEGEKPPPKKTKKPEAHGERRHKGKHHTRRSPTPSDESDSAASPPPPRRKTPKNAGTPDSSSSSMSTPKVVCRAREELAAAEAAHIARLQSKVNQWEDRQDRKKRKKHKKQHKKKHRM